MFYAFAQTYQFYLPAGMSMEAELTTSLYCVLVGLSLCLIICIQGDLFGKFNDDFVFVFVFIWKQEF